MEAIQLILPYLASSAATRKLPSWKQTSSGMADKKVHPYIAALSLHSGFYNVFVEKIVAQKHDTEGIG